MTEDIKASDLTIDRRKTAYIQSNGASGMMSLAAAAAALLGDPPDIPSYSMVKTPREPMLSGPTCKERRQADRSKKKHLMKGLRP